MNIDNHKQVFKKNRYQKKLFNIRTVLTKKKLHIKLILNTKTLARLLSTLLSVCDMFLPFISVTISIGKS